MPAPLNSPATTDSLIDRCSPIPDRTGNPFGNSRPWSAGLLSLFVVWTGIQAFNSFSKGGESFNCRFANVARKAGLNSVTVFGGQETNKYLLETTGCGVAFLDYNNDGLLDIFQVNGSVLEGFP